MFINKSNLIHKTITQYNTLMWKQNKTKTLGLEMALE
jgi:hypothetical protein